jgi:hypothetical protein
LASCSTPFGITESCGVPFPNGLFSTISATSDHAPNPDPINGTRRQVGCLSGTGKISAISTFLADSSTYQVVKELQRLIIARIGAIIGLISSNNHTSLTRRPRQNIIPVKP